MVGGCQAQPLGGVVNHRDVIASLTALAHTQLCWYLKINP
jgi:hypothetical protein